MAVTNQILSLPSCRPHSLDKQQSMLGAGRQAGTRDPGEQGRQSPPLGAFTISSRQESHTCACNYRL